MKRWKNNQLISGLLRGEELLEGFVFPGTENDEDNSSGKTSVEGRIMDSEFRWSVLASYERLLKGRSSPVEKECELPFPKDVIRRAIRQELLENPDSDHRSRFEVAYAQLESFVPPEEFHVIQEFKSAGYRAQEMAMSGDPGDLIASARILKKAGGDRAVKIEEMISEKMRLRLEQIRAIGSPVWSVEDRPIYLEH